MRHLVAGMVRRRQGYRRLMLFRDPAVQAALARDGYHLTGPALDEEAVADLVDGYQRWRSLRPPDGDGRFRFSGARPPTPASTMARAEIDRVLVPAVATLVDPTVARVGPAVFQVKPSSPHSGVRSHQDPFLVDEQRSFTVSAWTALTQVGIDDGPMIVLPGSHRYACWKRVATTTDDLAGYHDVIERHARVVLMEPGQVLLFDSALVHGSLVNRSGRTRIGASAVIVPRDSALTIPTPVEGPPPESVDVYRMEVDRATGSTPPVLTDGEPLGRVALARMAVGPEGFGRLCRLRRALYGPGAGRPVPPGLSTA